MYYKRIDLAAKKIDFLDLYQQDPFFYSALLESVSHGTANSSFDILFFDPQEILFLDAKEQLHLKDKFEKNIDDSCLESNNFLQVFNQLWLNNHSQTQLISEQELNYYPFSGGWFLFLAYELANQIEPELKLLEKNKLDEALVSAYACRYQTALIYDHVKKELLLFSENPDKIGEYENKLIEDINLLSLSTPSNLAINSEFLEDNEQHYLDAVDKINQYIIDGDVFQVNLSRQWSKKIKQMEHHQLACNLYRRLRKTNPAPFSALVHCLENSIISSSPERLVKVKNNSVESRPIAGTRPRGKTQQEDKYLINQLHNSPKENAEHIMLIDLIRNDLGRICKPGSIHVNEFMVNESYQFVHHIVSNLMGSLAKGVLPGDVIAAIFPGGTITGCPKVRCMEIIAELELSARGAYTGSLGYINNNGSMDLNILIRTMALKDNKTQQLLSLRAGAGIVADSIPEKELLEAYAKAKGMLKVMDINHS